MPIDQIKVPIEENKAPKTHSSANNEGRAPIEEIQSASIKQKYNPFQIQAKSI